MSGVQLEWLLQLLITSNHVRQSWGWGGGGGGSSVIGGVSHVGQSSDVAGLGSDVKVSLVWHVWHVLPAGLLTPRLLHFVAAVPRRRLLHF